jgi:hypothetical protein
VLIIACPHEYIGTTAKLTLASQFLDGSVGSITYFKIFDTHLKANLPLSVAEATRSLGLPTDDLVLLNEVLATANYDFAVTKVPGITPDVVAAAIDAR